MSEPRTVGPSQGALYAARQIANRHRPTVRSGKPFCIECDYSTAKAGCPTWQLIADVLPALTTPTPDASTGASEGLTEAERRTLGIRDGGCGCCFIVDSTGLREFVAARESAAATRARAEERERIAQAIEARGRQFDHRYAQDLFTDAARIARGDA